MKKKNKFDFTIECKSKCSHFENCVWAVYK